MTHQPTPSPPTAVSTPAEAEWLINHFKGVMEALLHLLEEETQLVRAGRLTEVARLQTTKSDLARLYLQDAARVKASRTFLATTLPAAFHDLRERHDHFRALLQINLTVLATAHAVSEGIMRGVSREVARKSSLQTYGASGRPTLSDPRQAVPLAVSRTL